ncbi:MAG: outer membrane protein assembly factor BamE, partial [Alphaproteobacteria bacterium]|nr:outer membrane protein assembly factor BamE [Alphaproteobacteria bacterium]
IKKGMTGGQVVEVLGSPNIVSTDENGNEVWVYDKFHTEGIVSGSNGITLGFSNIVAGTARQSQSTITIIIKYNGQGKVRDIAYHKSSF